MEKVGIDLISRLSDKFDNYIICLDELGVFGRELLEKDYKVIELGKGQGYKYKTLFELIRFFKMEGIQIVHTNNPSPHFWGGFAAFLAGIRPRIHTKHGRNFLYMKRRVFLSRISALFSDHIVCVSTDAAKLTSKIEKVPPKKISVIYNGINASDFIFKNKDEELLDELKLKRNLKIIGSIARFNKDKDQKTLIHAFDLIQKIHKDTRLLLVGDGNTYNDMKNLVLSLGLQNKIIFLGYRTDVKRILSILDVYVLSSHTEGISISLLEAMAMEIPVIATNVGGNYEIVTHNENGLLVDENSETDLAEKIKLILDNENLANQFRVAGRQTVIDKFCLKSMAKNYENLYFNLYNKIGAC